MGVSVLSAFRRREPKVPDLAEHGTPVIDARGVSVLYGETVAIDGVDLTVRAGEVLALVGPNGAGKSTVLAALSGDIDLDSGEVFIDGAPLGSWSDEDLAVRRGVLLQQIDVSFPFTVTQVVRMGRAPWAGTRAEAWDDFVIASALAEVELGEFSERVYSSLSGGERSRAALARVLAQEPGVLLLDEPTAALDIRHQELAFVIAGSRAARGDAVVAVVHDLDLAVAHADVVAVLAEGRVAAVGPPESVLTAELLSEVYRHPIDVVAHPLTGRPLVLPRRDRSGSPSGAGVTRPEEYSS